MNATWLLSSLRLHVTLIISANVVCLRLCKKATHATSLKMHAWTVPPAAAVVASACQMTRVPMNAMYANVNHLPISVMHARLRMPLVTFSYCSGPVWLWLCSRLVRCSLSTRTVMSTMAVSWWCLKCLPNKINRTCMHNKKRSSHQPWYYKASSVYSEGESTN